MNGGKDLILGNDKRRVSIIQSNEQPLYNILNGEALTDEFGTPIITEVDEYFLKDASKQRSTSVVFSTRTGSYDKILEVGIKTGISTYSSASTNNIGINTASINVGDIILGPSIPDATFVSRVGVGSIFISNNTTNTAPLSETIQIKRKSTSVSKSNPVWKISEQFKEVSQVSTTLLGINREERQLSLFSNVSSYGLDTDDFEFYSYSDGTSFESWEERRNEIYGNRYIAKLTEETQESAIKITSFPVPYSFPFGPRFEKLGFYNQTLFNQYINFINLGNDLYDYFDTGAGSGYPTEWKKKFLPRSIAKVDNGDVEYSAGISVAFAQIDTWTETWKDSVLNSNNLTDPVTGQAFNAFTISTILGMTYEDVLNTRAGYSSSNRRYAYLQSRRVFRYQPGRISGFTFGLRSSRETITGINIEWGIANPTDQYIFRVNAGQFSIVRRSTIPLEQSVLTRNGLTSSDQQFISSGDPYNSELFYTINIPQDKFNGDPLNSNGSSGYLINLEKITMYKIEFGWYGAIGVRFYAYIPVDNGEARWVVLHTIVIENSLGTPCLQDSYFRFKYSLDVQNTLDVRIPQYVYKYGASYYIDGGDEGTSQIYSVSTKQKTILSAKRKSLFGIRPKEYILNSVGTEIQNKKLIIPTELSISADSLTEVKVVTCSACPGFGHAYTPGVATTESGRYIDIQFSNANTIEAINDSYFTQDDIGSKIIAPSIYNAYISGVSEELNPGTYSKAVIKGVSGNNRSIPTSRVFDRVVGIATTIAIGSPYPHQVRLSNYNSYAASNFEFTGSQIEIQFVNPKAQDNYAHYADFLIGLTNKPPVTSGVDTLEGFTISGVTTTVLPNSSILYGEYSHNIQGTDENGTENSESWNISQPPLIMAIDSRIPILANPAGGTCSKATVNVLDPLQINNVNELNYEPGPTSNPSIPDPQGRRWIEIQGSFPTYNYDDGQIAVKSGSVISVTNSKFVGVTSSYIKTIDDSPVTFSYIQISQTLGSVGSNFSILIRPVRITAEGGVDSTKIFNYNPFPLYLVTKLKDNAQINNISVKESIGDFQRTISPKWYTYANTTVTNASGKADITGAAPTNFQEISRLSSALIDVQNEQELRPFIERDTIYVGANSTNVIELKKIFGADRTVITPDNNNIEATFLIAKKIDSGSTGTIEASINFKEQ